MGNDYILKSKKTHIAIKMELIFKLHPAVDCVFRILLGYILKYNFFHGIST